MKALSWKEPYASLMMHGKIETRTWKTHYRGKVLICATMSPFSENKVIEISGSRNHERIKQILGEEKEPFKGYAIAVGELVDCRPMVIEDQIKAFVKYDPNLWCHVYENVRPIAPFRWVGQQGWKTVTEEIINQITYLDGTTNSI